MMSWFFVAEPTINRAQTIIIAFSSFCLLRINTQRAGVSSSEKAFNHAVHGSVAVKYFLRFPLDVFETKYDFF